jgi:hypothetical protein
MSIEKDGENKETYTPKTDVYFGETENPEVSKKPGKFSKFNKYLLGIILLLISNALWTIDNISVQILKTAWKGNV